MRIIDRCPVDFRQSIRLGLLVFLAIPLFAMATVPLTLNQMTKQIPEDGAMVQSQDPAFQRGADIYFGRKQYKKYKYCLAVIEKNGKYTSKKKLPVSARAPLSRETMRAFRRADLLTFLNSVFDCDAPTKLIFKRLKSDDIKILLYYFNKKYKLKLKT